MAQFAIDSVPSYWSHSGNENQREGSHVTHTLSAAACCSRDSADWCCAVARRDHRRRMAKRQSATRACPLIPHKRKFAGQQRMSGSLIGRLGVKHFQTIHHCSVDIARGLVLLFGLGTRALPSWGSKTRWNNLLRGLAARVTAEPSGHTNLPHPSSRKGHLSTARWSSKCSPIVFDPLRFLCCCRGLFPGPAELSAVDQMRCMITANRRARATMAFFNPRCLAIFIAQALSQDHFAERNSMAWAAS